MSSPLIVALIITRELLVTGLRVYAINENMIIESSRLAKYKTTFQIMAVIGLLLHYTYDLGPGAMNFPVNFQVVGTTPAVCRACYYTMDGNRLFLPLSQARF